jgi:uncharacterized membrane protein
VTGATGATAASSSRTIATERRIGRLLIVMTTASVGLLVIGMVLMAADGIDPRSGGPDLDVPALVARLAALDPAAFLWLGLLTVVAAPIARVVVAAVAYARDGDRLLLAISLGILLVVVVGIVSALTATV